LAGSLTGPWASRMPMNAVDAAFSTVGGGLGGYAASKLMPLRGFEPNPWLPRDASNFGKNSQRMIGQEAIDGGVGGAFGSVVDGIYNWLRRQTRGCK
jgi:hypothetical protein